MKQQSKAKEPDNKLATRAPAEIAPRDDRPAYLRTGAAAAGFDHMEQGDMTLPRLGLCQSMSPQRKRTDPKYIPNLTEGLFFNTITQKVYGESVKLTPLLFYKSRILFTPMDEGGGILCQAPDAKHGQGDPGGECAKCPKAMFTKDDKPECSLFYNYPALLFPDKGLPGLEDVVVVSFKSAGLKVSRDWNTLMRLRNSDMFAGVYELSSVETKNNIGTWMQPVIKNAGWIPEPMLAVAKQAYAAMHDLAKAGRLRADVSDLTREPGDEGPNEM